jgi:hypothetical protein
MRGRVNEEGKEVWICLRYFLYMNEYGILKLVKVILRRGVGKKGRTMEGMSQTGIYTYRY